MFSFLSCAKIEFQVITVCIVVHEEFLKANINLIRAIFRAIFIYYNVINFMFLDRLLFSYHAKTHTETLTSTLQLLFVWCHLYKRQIQTLKIQNGEYFRKTVTKMS